MSDPIIVVERDGPVAIVTMNRPEAMNALNRALRRELVLTFRGLAEDPDIRAAVLTGNGRAFTAGVDLIEGLSKFPWPIIGAINGFAITGGFELALACDVLLASENARFADTHARVGIMPGWGLSQKLSRLIGISRAKELSFTGNFLDAETAASWGLVNRVYAADQLMPAAIKLGHDMASCDSNLLKSYKAIIDDGFAASFGDGLQLEIERSVVHARTVTADGVEAARKTVTERGRNLKS